MSDRWQQSRKRKTLRHGWKVYRPVVIVVALVAVVAALLVPRVTATTTTHPAKATTTQPQKGLEVEQTAMVLDAAGATCRPLTNGQKLCEPVHKPLGSETTHVAYAPDQLGVMRVVKTDVPELAVGTPMRTQVVLGGAGKTVPMHAFYQSTGWHHFPCGGCNSGRILQSTVVKSFQICTIYGGCPVKLGPISAYGPIYTQQVYGAFLAPFGSVAVYNFAHYYAGVDHGTPGTYTKQCNCQPGVKFSNNGPGPQSLFWYRDNFLMQEARCGPSGQDLPGFQYYAADMQFDSRGDYTEAGWISVDGLPGSCYTAFGGMINGTHMA